MTANDVVARETRSHPGLELRYVAGRPRLVGYAAVFNVRSMDLGGFVEVVAPGAFTRTLRGSDVRAFVGHDDTRIIGRESNGTLTLEEDQRGLRVEIIPPDTQDGRDVIENVRTGLLDGMSFGFTVAPDGAAWDFKTTPPVRHLRDVNLFEVSVVALPAWPDTTIALRSLEAARRPRVDDLRARLDAALRGRR